MTAWEPYQAAERRTARDRRKKRRQRVLLTRGGLAKANRGRPDWFPRLPAVWGRSGRLIYSTAATLVSLIVDIVVFLLAFIGLERRRL